MMDYASRLGAAGQTLNPGTAQTLAGDYAGLLTGAGGGSNPGQFQIAMAPGAQVTPDQQSILDVMLGLFNNPGMLADPKMKGPK